MAGRHVAGGYGARVHRPGHPRAVRRDPGPFWAYLDAFTIRGYARDFFTPENHRPMVGFVCGVLFLGGGLTRMVTQPGWQSLGLIFVGAAVAVLCFLFPLLLDLASAASTHLHRPRGKRRREV